MVLVVGGTSATYGHALTCNSSDGVQVGLMRNFGRVSIIYSPVLVQCDETICNSSPLLSKEIQQVLFDLSKTPKKQLPDFLLKLPQKFK